MNLFQKLSSAVKLTSSSTPFAKLSLSAENPVVKAALELDLRKLNEAPPSVSAATGGLLGAKARRVRHHCRPRAQARSCIRAARYRATEATGATPLTESVESSHPLDSSVNVGDQSRKFKVL